MPKTTSGFYSFHIHEGSVCDGEVFSKSKGHYNPKDRPHPSHAGDFPPLMSCAGSAYTQFKTDHFRVCEIIGRTVIIHSGTDDFHTQPSENAGEKIACGIIRPVSY